jgi:hypothetical protein
VHTLGPLLGVRVAAADDQRATGADDLALGDEMSRLAGASMLTLSSTVSTSASSGITVSAA